MGLDSLLSSSGLLVLAEPLALALTGALTMVFGLDLAVLLGFLDMMTSSFPSHERFIRILYPLNSEQSDGFLRPDWIIK